MDLYIGDKQTLFIIIESEIDVDGDVRVAFSTSQNDTEHEMLIDSADAAEISRHLVSVFNLDL